jgi:hypothetical protein
VCPSLLSDGFSTRILFQVTKLLGHGNSPVTNPFRMAVLSDFLLLVVQTSVESEWMQSARDLLPLWVFLRPFALYAFPFRPRAIDE